MFEIKQKSNCTTVN